MLASCSFSPVLNIICCLFSYGECIIPNKMMNKPDVYQGHWRDGKIHGFGKYKWVPCFPFTSIYEKVTGSHSLTWITSVMSEVWSMYLKQYHVWLQYWVSLCDSLGSRPPKLGEAIFKLNAHVVIRPRAQPYCATTCSWLCGSYPGSPVVRFTRAVSVMTGGTVMACWVLVNWQELPPVFLLASGSRTGRRDMESMMTSQGLINDSAASYGTYSTPSSWTFYL